jgi:hypothetical protein
MWEGGGAPLTSRGCRNPRSSRGPWRREPAVVVPSPPLQQQQRLPAPGSWRRQQVAPLAWGALGAVSGAPSVAQRSPCLSLCRLRPCVSRSRSMGRLGGGRLELLALRAGGRPQPLPLPLPRHPGLLQPQASRLPPLLRRSPLGLRGPLLELQQQQRQQRLLPAPPSSLPPSPSQASCPRRLHTDPPQLQSPRLLHLLLRQLPHPLRRQGSNSHSSSESSGPLASQCPQQA